MSNQTDNINVETTNVLISKRGRSLILLIFATILVSALAGVLGAFKSGKFYKTYDYIEVGIPYEEVNFDDPIFKDKTKGSREIIKWEKEYSYDIETGEEIITHVKMYKGYYTKYFFQSGWFYADAGLNSLMVMILYIALVNFLIVRRTEKNDVHNKLEGELNDLVIEKNSLPSTTFEPYMEKWNNKRKINQHIANIKYKLALLEKKTPYKIKKTFYVKTDEGMIFQLPKDLTTLNKKEQKYLDKKEELEAFLEQEYIDKHVIFEKVDHFKYIHPSFVTTGKNEVIKSTDEYSSIKSNKQKQSEDYVRKAFLGLAFTFSVGVILSFVLFRIEDHWLIVLYSVLLKLLPLVLQIIFANDYSNRHIEYQMIPNLRYRLNIASMYLVYIKIPGEEIISNG